MSGCLVGWRGDRKTVFDNKCTSGHGGAHSDLSAIDNGVTLFKELRQPLSPELLRLLQSNRTSPVGQVTAPFLDATNGYHVVATTSSATDVGPPS